MIVCKNCGAKFDEKEVKCPFCGYFNYIGAEEEYKGKLNHLHDDLEELNQLPKLEVKKEVKRSLKAIVITIVIFGGFLIALSGFNMIFEYDRVSGKEAEELKDTIIWKYGAYLQVDELYAAGDYDGILEFQDNMRNEPDYSYNYNLYSWEHYEFIELYQKCLNFLESQKRIEELGMEYEVGSMLYTIVSIQLADPELYTDKEWELIETYIEETKTYAYDVLQFTESELQDLCQEASGDGMVYSSVCYDYEDVVLARFGLEG